jgi:flavin reductase (DIM6/NTAB) family NADH-FMN oxidoreductase RutF
MDHVELQPSVLYFGTPVTLVSTLNEDGTANLAPISSSWYLGYTAVIGLGQGNQTLDNLRRHGECVLNLPSAAQHEAVERLAPLTGRRDVPPEKQARYRYEPRKFAAAGLTEQVSTVVAPPRVGECPVQLEAVAARLHDAAAGGFAVVELRIVRVHVASQLVVPGTQHVDVARWRPLFYVFRHYLGLGDDLGSNFRAAH